MFGFSLMLMLVPLHVYAQQERQMEGERNMQEKSPDSETTKPEDIKRSPIRAILNKITIGANVGYGLNYYQQDLPYTIKRSGERHFLSPDGSSWYSGWVNNMVKDPTGVTASADGLVKGDTADLKLQGFGHSLPIALDLHFLIMDRFRIGGGAGLEFFSIRPLDFKNDEELLGRYNSGVSTAIAWRYYGMLGARVIRWGNWDHSVDLRVGKKNYLSQFENVNTSVFANLGFTMERHYSEYFRFTLRPALEWFSFTSIPATSVVNTDNSLELKTTAPSFYIQAGVSFNFPRLARCPMKACHVQLEHVHGGKEFRGQPIYRWQNPKYGQNHPELQRNLKRRKGDTEQRLQKRPNRKGAVKFR